MPAKLRNKIPHIKDVTKRFLKIALATLAGLMIFSSFYHIYFAQRIIPGVAIGNIKIGGMTYGEAKTTLEKYWQNSPKAISLKWNDYSAEIKSSEIGLKYDWDATARKAFEVGRTGNLLTDTKEKIAGVVKPLYVTAVYSYVSDSLSNETLTFDIELNAEGQDAHFIINGQKIDIAQAIFGRKIDNKSLYSEVIDSLNDVNFSSKPLVVVSKDPNFTAQDLSSLQSQVSKIVFNQFKVTYQNESWPLNPAQILDLLTFQRDKGQTYIDLNSGNFDTYIETFGQDVNKLPRGQVTGEENGKVTGFKLIQDGVQIDTKSFKQNFKGALLSLKATVEIPTILISGPSDPSKYGILSLLGEGKSKFIGSANGRIHNLSLAAERTNGVLVPPQSIYSFNKTIGDISVRTGYDVAYIIQNGRTILGEGGGVCQTSTTLFRAVLNSGLPIVTRYPHAYRVHYYEEESPVGYDASVFQPTLDFQFKNDSPNYIMIQSSTDVSTNSLNFKIYGTPDGRTVNLSQPVVTNLRPAPAALYQDDPTLPKGVVRQVDFAAGGADVFFTRQVKRDGQLIISDTFSSKYQPWRAVFLVGTKK